MVQNEQLKGAPSRVQFFCGWHIHLGMLFGSQTFLFALKFQTSPLSICERACVCVRVLHIKTRHLLFPFYTLTSSTPSVRASSSSKRYKLCGHKTNDTRDTRINIWVQLNIYIRIQHVFVQTERRVCLAMPRHRINSGYHQYTYVLVHTLMHILILRIYKVPLRDVPRGEWRKS